MGGTLLSIGGYALNIGTATGTTYLTDYNADGGRAVPYVCQVNMAGLPNDLTIRIERRTGGLRFLQFWDQQGTYYPPGLCWDTSTGSTTQNPRTTNDRFWPTSPTTPGRLGADTYNSDKFNGRVAWFRIYGAAANSNSAPPTPYSTANLLFGAEFEGNLADSGPNSLVITSTATPFTFFAGTP